MDNPYYKKVGRRYEMVGHEFRGFLCDGIWQVRDGTNSQTCLITNDEHPPILALPYRAHVNDLCKVIQGKYKERGARGASLWEQCQWVCDYFAEVAGQQMDKGKRL